MEQPHIGMEDIINYQKEQIRNLLLNARCRFWCHRSSLYHLVNMEHCTQNTFFMHQNLDNVFSNLMTEHGTISLHGIVRTPPVESNVLATTPSFFTSPGPVYLCLCLSAMPYLTLSSKWSATRVNFKCDLIHSSN